MKICLINNLFAPYNRGGAEEIVKIIADNLISLDNEVFIISTKPYNAKPEDIQDGLKVCYINSFYYNLHKLPKWLRFFWHLVNIFDFITANKVKEILIKEKADVVITNNLVGLSSLVPLAIKKAKIKHLHIAHDIQLLHPSGLLIYGQENVINSVFSRFYQSINRLMFSETDVIIFPSEWLNSLYTKHQIFTKAKRLVLNNPIIINTNQFPRQRNEIFKILYVGQIEKHKGVLFLVETIKEMLTDVNFELEIIGSGEKNNVLAEMIKNESKIKHLGRVDKSEVAIKMQANDLLIIPSLCYENSPTVFFEALCQGLPVLASDLGGSRELAIKYGGELFASGNKKDLAEKIKSIIKNPQALEEIREKYLLSSGTLRESASQYAKTLINEISKISQIGS